MPVCPENSFPGGRKTGTAGQSRLRYREIYGHAVERSLHKGTDLTLSAHDHAENAGHDAADSNDAAVGIQKGAQGISVAEREGPREVDAHEVVFFRSQVGGGSKAVVFRIVLSIADAAQDLFLRLRINPDPKLPFAFYFCLLGDESVDILSFPSRIRADINRVDILVGEDPFYDPELFLRGFDHLVFVGVRDEWNGVHRPFLVFFVIRVRIAHRDEVAYAPGYDRVAGDETSVSLPEIHIQCIRKLTRDTRFFCNENLFSHEIYIEVR